MIKPGIVSVTFRELTPKEVIEVTAKAGLKAVEWGGDIHVPTGDLEKAKRVGELTREAGLEVASYGSYYKAGVENPFTFEQVAATALALGAPNIRVWAGDKGTAQAAKQDWHRVADDSRRAAQIAEEQGMTLSFEYHGGTLTDHADSTLGLLALIHHPNAFTYWQPPNNASFEARMQSLETVLVKVTNLHVFHWTGENNFRHPLEEGRKDWSSYFSLLGDKDRYALMEFVASPQAFPSDAKTLLELLANE